MEMEEVFENTRSLWLLPVTGLVSAFLAIAQRALLPGTSIGGDIYMFDPGALFGGAIAAYYLLFEGFQGRWKILAFVAACIGAALIAGLCGVASEPYFPAGDAQSGELFPTPLPVFFVGGFAGAAVVIGSARFLFGPKGMGWRAGPRVLLAAIGGGVLGVFGWAAGPILGTALWTVFHILRLTPAGETVSDAVRADDTQVLSLEVAWQTGVAFCLALLMWIERNFMTREGDEGARRALV